MSRPGSVSQVRQNYDEECEKAINKQINMELYASYVYLSMAYYFDRDDVALHGFHKFFRKMSDEEREHADKLLKYQNQRGGRVLLENVERPNRDEWGTGLDAMQAALSLEKNVNESLLKLHKLASDKGDPQDAREVVKRYVIVEVPHSVHFRCVGVPPQNPVVKLVKATHWHQAMLCDFIETHYLPEQVESIKELGDYITNLKRVGQGLGEYMFDHETLDS